MQGVLEAAPTCLMWLSVLIDRWWSFDACVSRISSPASTAQLKLYTAAVQYTLDPSTRALSEHENLAPVASGNRRMVKASLVLFTIWTKTGKTAVCSEGREDVITALKLPGLSLPSLVSAMHAFRPSNVPVR